MDQLTHGGRPLPPPFHARDLQLHHHHQFQHQPQNPAEDEQNSGNSSLKLDRGDDINDYNISPTGTNSNGGGATTEVMRRPAGSKNKPETPIIITRDSANALRTLVMDIAKRCDIQDSISTFAKHLQRGFCNLSVTVTNVTLCHPAAPGSFLTLQGRFDILSLSGRIGSKHPPPLSPIPDPTHPLCLLSIGGTTTLGHLTPPLCILADDFSQGFWSC